MEDYDDLGSVNRAWGLDRKASIPNAINYLTM